MFRLLLDSGGRSYPFAVTFAENLTRERARRGITQVQLAEWLGVKQAQISSWERGRRLPEADSIERIAAALSRVEPPCLPATLLAGVLTDYDRLRGSVEPTPATPAAPSRLSSRARRLLRVFEQTNAEGQRHAIRSVLAFHKAFPLDASQQSDEQFDGRTAEKGRRVRGRP